MRQQRQVLGGKFDCNGQPSLFRDGRNRKPESNEVFTKHTITEYLTQEK